MDVRVDYKDVSALKNVCFQIMVLEKTPRVPWRARRSNQSILKEVDLEQSLEGLCWSSSTLTTWCEELTHLKRPWCWEGLKVGGKGDDRGWDVWMASLTQWTWVWANSRRYWKTGKPDVLQFMGSQRVGRYLATEQDSCIFLHIEEHLNHYLEMAGFLCMISYLLMFNWWMVFPPIHPLQKNSYISSLKG